MSAAAQWTRYQPGEKVWYWLPVSVFISEILVPHRKEAFFNYLLRAGPV